MTKTNAIRSKSYADVIPARMAFFDMLEKKRQWAQFAYGRFWQIFYQAMVSFFPCWPGLVKSASVSYTTLEYTNANFAFPAPSAAFKAAALPAA
jgi:hypothetical protein